MQRHTTIEAIRAAVAAARAAGDRIALVPTMGALHDGHLALVERAAELAEFRVVSIFVNPTQFAPDEDLDAYPRELDSDEAKLRALGGAAPQAVFAPEAGEVYPDGAPLTTVTVDRITGVLCGVSRPTHFDGVTTVVAKLLNIVAPDVAVFGRKDFQQQLVIRRMVADLDIPVEIEAVPTVREPDGVALSSRNRYLEGPDREAAQALSQGLRQAVTYARQTRDEGGRPDPDRVLDEVRGTLEAEPRVRIDYVEVLDPETLETPDAATREEPPVGREDATDPGGPVAPQRLLIAVAAHVGPARLIDNVVVGDIQDEERLLEATTPA